VCGRFTQAFSYGDLHAYFSFFGQPLGNLAPRYSLCPTQDIVVVRSASDGGHELERMRWGLVPAWWRKPLRELPATFNARVETVAEKPTFRAAFRSRRCVIPATGTYEWESTPDGKQPWYFTPSEGAFFLIAGLWEEALHPELPGQTIRSTTMLIGNANPFVGQYHDRMPILLNRETMQPWLSGAAHPDTLEPPGDGAIRATPVSRRLNNARVNDDETLITPVDLQSGRLL
jgi:putative SOS response-associated peptidase YedK